MRIFQQIEKEILIKNELEKNFPYDEQSKKNLGFRLSNDATLIEELDYHYNNIAIEQKKALQNTAAIIVGESYILQLICTIPQDYIILCDYSDEPKDNINKQIEILNSSKNYKQFIFNIEKDLRNHTGIFHFDSYITEDQFLSLKDNLCNKTLVFLNFNFNDFDHHKKLINILEKNSLFVSFINLTNLRFNYVDSKILSEFVTNITRNNQKKIPYLIATSAAPPSDIQPKWFNYSPCYASLLDNPNDFQKIYQTDCYDAMKLLWKTKNKFPPLFFLNRKFDQNVNFLEEIKSLYEIYISNNLLYIYRKKTLLDSIYSEYMIPHFCNIYDLPIPEEESNILLQLKIFANLKKLDLDNEFDQLKKEAEIEFDSTDDYKIRTCEI